jgi:hypothetical protein
MPKTIIHHVTLKWKADVPDTEKLGLRRPEGYLGHPSEGPVDQYQEDQPVTFLKPS